MIFFEEVVCAISNRRLYFGSDSYRDSESRIFLKYLLSLQDTGIIVRILPINPKIVDELFEEWDVSLATNHSIMGANPDHGSGSAGIFNRISTFAG